MIILDDSQKKYLLEIAKKSIEYGLENGHPFKPEPGYLDTWMRVKAATFVTLYLRNDLQGCIGSIKAVHELIQDVCRNAFYAAFRDFRFTPVKKEDLYELKIEISILSTPEKLRVESEEGLIEYLSRNHCGLILKYRESLATYLPSVWSKISDPEKFLNNLKEKAGLKQEFWSNELEFYSYHTEKIP